MLWKTKLHPLLVLAAGAALAVSEIGSFIAGTLSIIGLTFFFFALFPINLVVLPRLLPSVGVPLFAALAARLGLAGRPHAEVFGEIRARINYLCDVGLGYLALDRQSRSLSGGEVQRINLTTALGTSLVNTLFVLDEPSIGLHPRDMGRVIDVMKRLRDKGVALILITHKLVEAYELGDRISVLRLGRVVGELPPKRSPVIPGHQVVGVVEQRGPRANRFAVGTRVGVPWLGWTCGACAYCRRGRENLCERARFQRARSLRMMNTSELVPCRAGSALQPGASMTVK